MLRAQNHLLNSVRGLKSKRDYVALEKIVSSIFARGIQGWAAPALLLAILFFFGLTGRDPWKADESYIFGVIHSMLEDGSWLVPLLAGELFMGKSPLICLACCWAGTPSGGLGERG